MCCFLPRTADEMDDNGMLVDAAVVCRTYGIPKEAAKSVTLDGATNAQDKRMNDAAPPSPVTPSPRMTSTAWQSPSQGVNDEYPVSFANERSQQHTRVRWAVNIKDWNPWDDEWLFLLDLLPEEDQKEVCC
jgi:hypothetical protein